MNLEKAFPSRILFGALLPIVAACSNQPPGDFAPDPSLVAQIREIQIVPAQARACPGSGIQASYDAVLNDGTHVPFQRTYDKKQPPRLHVSFLEFSSNEARSTGNGNWVSDRDPLFSASTGFRLSATLKAKPSVHGAVTIYPDYSCAAHAFDFQGARGGVAQAGENGPEVTVRLGMGRSPFYDSLIIASIQVGMQAPFYELYDARTIAPADWLTVMTRGGLGGNGIAGSKGGNGVSAVDRCPSQAGGPGGDGGTGGAGAPGGRGGPVTVVVSAEQPFMAGLVTARSPGGAGGTGGEGGPGGVGGKGSQGAPTNAGMTCAVGEDGAAGRRGQPGPVGSEGPRGPRTIIVTVPADQLFGPGIPAELAALIATSPRRP